MVAVDIIICKSRINMKDSIVKIIFDGSNYILRLMLQKNIVIVELKKRG